MKEISFFRSGCGSCCGIELVVLRWGGGAQPGKHHMFLCTTTCDERAGLPLVSAHCVVDDFGDLVEVPQ